MGFLSCTKGHHRLPLRDRWRESFTEQRRPCENRGWAAEHKAKEYRQRPLDVEEARDQLPMEAPLRTQPPEWYFKL